MDKSVAGTRTQNSAPLRSLTIEDVTSAVLESAIEAFFKGILVLIFGSIAIGIAGSIWEEMIPSAPPGLPVSPEAEPTAWSAVRAFSAEHQLLLVFIVLFIPTLWQRLRHGENGAEALKPASRLAKLGKKLSEQWFELLVGNAFGALVAAVVVTIVQQFTAVNLLLNVVVSPVLDLIQYLFGTGTRGVMQAWWDWYGDNQLKFAFWLFYLAAACDDLGLPNFKTLGRWLGRRVRNRRKNRRSVAEKGVPD